MRGSEIQIQVPLLLMGGDSQHGKPGTYKR
jgi:hypothetical protein